MSETAILVRNALIHGRPCYEVPRQENRPRLPKNKGFSFFAFYSEDKTVVLVVATPPLARYLEDRKYATYIGVARHHKDGEVSTYHPGRSSNQGAV